MFLGLHATQIKNSNRLSIPKQWKKLISNGVYLTQGFDQNLWILTPDVFQAIYEQMTALNIADPLARLLLRMFLSAASYVEDVENETISLPQNLLDYASIDDNAVVVGQGSYIEVWSPNLWSRQKEEIQNAQANAQRFSSFVIKAKT